MVAPGRHCADDPVPVGMKRESAPNLWGLKMRFRKSALIGSSAVLGLLAASPAVFAQETLAATAVGAEASVALQTSAQDDAGGSGDFLQQYKPQANTWELGAFAGLLFISDQNSFRGAPSTE